MFLVLSKKRKTGNKPKVPLQQNGEIVVCSFNGIIIPSKESEWKLHTMWKNPTNNIEWKKPDIKEYMYLIPFYYVWKWAVLSYDVRSQGSGYIWGRGLTSHWKGKGVLPGFW